MSLVLALSIHNKQQGVHVVHHIGEIDFFLLPSVCVFIFVFLVAILGPPDTIPERLLHVLTVLEEGPNHSK